MIYNLIKTLEIPSINKSTISQKAQIQ